MIKVVAFDLVGVLAFEKDIKLTDIESKLEKKFGHNIDDKSYLEEFKDYSNVEIITKNIINKLYKVKNQDVINKLKKENKDMKLIVATNHLSYVKDFIKNNIQGIDDILISAEINKIKPSKEFYQYILNKYNIKSSELLFIDDRLENVLSAKELSINVIKVDKDTDIYIEALKYIKNN